MRLRVHLLLAVAGLFASVSVSAQQMYFSANAPSQPWIGTVQLELGSVSAGTAYQPYDGAYYQALAAHPMAVSNAFAAQYAGAELRFAYDAATAPGPGSDNTGAYYATGAVVARLTDTQGAQTTLQARDPVAVVLDMPVGRFFDVAGSAMSASAVSYQDAAPQSFKADLVSLAASFQMSSSGGGFDLSAFSSLPVHLTGPSEYQVRSVSLYLSAFAANPPEPPNLGLPKSFDLSIYYDTTIALWFEGDFTMSLDAADYSTPEAFAAAQAWLAANPLQLDARANLEFHINTLNPQDGGWGGPLGLGADWYVPSAVPEPASGMLWLGGLMFGAVLLRPRRRNLLRAG